MKILMVQDTFLPKLGGAEIHVWKLSRALRQRGHKIAIATATGGSPEVDGFQVYRFPLLASQGKRALIALPLYLPTIARLVYAHDIIHGHYTAMCSAVFGMVASCLKRPFVVTLHGYGTLESSVRRNFYMRTWRRLVFLRAEKVIATSKEMEEVAACFVPRHRIVYIPNGVDTSEFVSSFTPSYCGPIRLATVRRLVPKNGVQFLIEALPLIMQRAKRPIECWIIGDGPLRGYLETRVKQLGIEQIVRFFGMLPNQRMKDVLEQVHILVFPSSAESTSIAALEAMAMSKPIVASAVGGYPELIGDNERGVLVHLFDNFYSNYDAPLSLPVERLQVLADAIAELVNDPKKAQTLGVQARTYVQKHHDWSIISKRVESVYESLLREN